MKTSVTIKDGQKRLPTILDWGENKLESWWIIQGRDEPSYRVIRPKSRKAKFVCGCKAGHASLLCRHVVAVVTEVARESGWDRVSLWTSRGDAARQRRRLVEFETATGSFFATLNATWIPKRRGAHVTRIKPPAATAWPGTERLWDVFFRRGKRAWRECVQR